MQVTTHTTFWSELTGMDDTEGKDFLNQRIHLDTNLVILQGMLRKLLKKLTKR